MTSFFDVRSSVFMRINGNFVTIVGLTNDERCLIHNLHVENDYRASEKNHKNVFE